MPLTYKRIKFLIGLFVIFFVVSKIINYFLPATILINQAGFSQAVYSREDQLLKLTLSSDDKYRLFVPLDKISKNFIKTILLQEDQYYYYHLGVNPLGIIRGAWLTYFHGRRTGGSTISMQLARMRFGISSRRAVGKLNQILWGLGLEFLYSKDEILEAYLNLIPFGGNIEGIASASRIYLNKRPAELTLAESYLLAAIPKSPAARNPQKFSERLTSAASELLKRDSKSTISVSELEKVELSGRPSDLPKEALHLVTRLTSELPFQSEIKTTISLDLQQTIEEQITNFTKKNKSLGVTNATAILTDCNSMEVQAYVGSANFWNNIIQGQVDGITARRSPGSVLKPFIYALALEQGLIHPSSILKDSFLSRAAYNPENYERDFVGPISATSALVRSRNLPAVKLLNSISPERYLDFLKFAGVKSLKSVEHYGLALALGGVEVSPEDISRMYCLLANSGTFKNLKLIPNKDYSGKPLLSPEATTLVREMLKTNETQNYSQHSSQAIKVAWKTGTSYGFKDAWTAGLFGNYALVIWTGNFDGTANPAFLGRETAAVLFFRIFDALVSKLKIAERQVANVNVRKVKVCATSGDLPGLSCKHLSDSWFIPGVSPIKTCQVHRLFRINPKTKLASCSFNNPNLVEEVYEVWDSDIQEVFSNAGITLKSLPDFEQDCSLSTFTEGRPVITSPQEKLIYRLEKTRVEIPLTVTTGGESKHVTWFINDNFLAKVAVLDTFFWQAIPGKHLIRVIDDQGRSTEISIVVMGR